MSQQYFADPVTQGQSWCMSFTVHPVTARLLPALEELFGSAGACNGCWCMHWRIGTAYKKRPREQNRQALREIVNDGPPPGLLAFDGELPVGWCQLTPRTDLPWLDDGARYLGRVDDVPVWTLSCFYVRRSHRHRDVAAALIDAAVHTAKDAAAPELEAYPIDTGVPGHSSNIFTGTAAMFESAGFRMVASRAPSRPIMRHDLTMIGRTLD